MDGLFASVLASDKVASCSWWVGLLEALLECRWIVGQRVENERSNFAVRTDCCLLARMCHVSSFSFFLDISYLHL